MNEDANKKTPDEKRLLISTRYAGVVKCDRSKGGCGGEFETQARFLSHFNHFDPGEQK